ncbi:sodium/proline symporter [Okeania hirsuta]|uniref:Sodium/proline symporter n=2 Tax=Microcoleaceae TaxID=1892252 RepID=A0A3N6QRM3_9CYAN|nr:sodium/proline symporter [Okeania sp. SIO2B9]NET75517.1 sodium/proline symporter [Okeania sp. SIO1F9]RQH52020.1 sodium/proline symporter [Okeania hirsuta]
MDQQIWIAITFIAFLLSFTVVGIYSATQKQNTTNDYLLASRNVNPWLTALSAMATGQSGYLFIGVIGFTYKVGVASIWIPVAWAIGDYIAWWLIFKKLRLVSQQTNSDTVSSFLGQENLRSGKNNGRLITIISALITIAFLGTYASAQLVAASKGLNAIFGWNYQLGVIIGAVIVVIYCFSGGIRASIWTDSVQAILMIGSLLVLCIVGLINCGGFGELWTKLNAIDPTLTNLIPANLPWGFFPYFLGWIVAGFGAVGQPHILVRAMAIDSAENVAFARNIKFVCGQINSATAFGVGLTARALLPDLITSSDPELALPYLSMELLPAVMVGLMLAGLFSAAISTADSQILSCSAALSQDLIPNTANSYRMAKIATLVVTAIVLVIALTGDNNVFALVIFSWSILACGLGPLLVLRVWQKPISVPVAIAMMIIGIIVSIAWNLGLGLSSAIYEVLPGMATGFIVYGIVYFLTDSRELSK